MSVWTHQMQVDLALVSIRRLATANGPWMNIAKPLNQCTYSLPGKRGREREREGEWERERGKSFRSCRCYIMHVRGSLSALSDHVRQELLLLWATLIEWNFAERENIWQGSFLFFSWKGFILIRPPNSVPMKRRIALQPSHKHFYLSIRRLIWLVYHVMLPGLVGFIVEGLGRPSGGYCVALIFHFTASVDAISCTTTYLLPMYLLLCTSTYSVLGRTKVLVFLGRKEPFHGLPCDHREIFISRRAISWLDDQTISTLLSRFVREIRVKMVPSIFKVYVYRGTRL